MQQQEKTDKKLENEATFRSWKETKDEQLKKAAREKRVSEKKKEEEEKKQIEKKKEAEMVSYYCEYCRAILDRMEF